MCQVTFHLSKDNTFTAEAVDLNSGRHHLWQVNRVCCSSFKPTQDCRTSDHASDSTAAQYGPFHDRLNFYSH